MKIFASSDFSHDGRSRSEPAEPSANHRYPPTAYGKAVYQPPAYRPKLTMASPLGRNDRRRKKPSHVRARRRRRRSYIWFWFWYWFWYWYYIIGRILLLGVACICIWSIICREGVGGFRILNLIFLHGAWECLLRLSQFVLRAYIGGLTAFLSPGVTVASHTV